MKRHTKIYFNYFGYGEQDFIPCEICGKRAVDVAHIDARGMGGNPSGDKDVIENLMGKCRVCHDKYGDKEQFMEWLKNLHLEFMKNKDVR